MQELETPEEDVEEAIPREEELHPTEPENPEEETEETPEQDESGENESTEESKESEEEPKDDSEETEEEDGEIVVSLEGEEEPEEEEKNAPKWVKNLRKDYRESKRENRQLKTEVETLKTQLTESAEKKDQPIELGAKPDPDDYYGDPEGYAKVDREWHDRKQKLDEQESAKREELQKRQQAFDKHITAYQERKSATKVKNFEELEEIAKTSLSKEIQSAIIMEADDPLMLVAAIGGNPKVLEKFQNVTSGVALGKLIASTESKINMNKTSTRKPPPPEKTIKGNAPASSSVNTTLEKLRARAEKTGDYTEVIKYKNSLKNKK